jgi:prepilin-type N-terminal cleavage/methylation domain-containing protein
MINPTTIICSTKPKNHGFTLVEMAVVLVIVGLMLGGLLVPISAQIDQRNYNETQKKLDEIKEALIGFAIMNGRLPCPTTQADPSNANYGVEDPGCPALTSDGYIPWKTLGVSEFDAWGTVRNVSTDPWVGHWHYRVDSNFSVAITSITTGFSADALSIRDSAGNSLTTTTERPIALVFSTGKNLVADGENATYESTNGLYQNDVPTPTFDDHLIWLSRPLLMNRMVMAGKLP